MSNEIAGDSFPTKYEESRDTIQSLYVGWLDFLNDLTDLIQNTGDGLRLAAAPRLADRFVGQPLVGAYPEDTYFREEQGVIRRETFLGGSPRRTLIGLLGGLRPITIGTDMVEIAVVVNPIDTPTGKPNYRDIQHFYATLPEERRRNALGLRGHPDEGVLLLPKLLIEQNLKLDTGYMEGESSDDNAFQAYFRHRHPPTQ